MLSVFAEFGEGDGVWGGQFARCGVCGFVASFFGVCLELIGLIASAVFRVCGVVRYTQTYKMM